MLAQRVVEVARALRAGDEQAARSELTELAHEATLLATQPTLVWSTLSARMTIAVERERSGRGATS